MVVFNTLELTQQQSWTEDVEPDKNTLEKAPELIRELPTSSKAGALATLGTLGTLMAAGYTAASMWRVYQEVSTHRWFWENHVITGLVKLRELGVWRNLAGINLAFDMLSVGALRRQRRSGWYSSKPFVNPDLTLTRSAKIGGVPLSIYIALGDSAAQGMGCEDVQDSYVALLTSYLCRATRRRVIMLNLSISGAISFAVTGTELPGLLALEVKPDLITLDTGGNDTFTDDVGIPAELFGKSPEVVYCYLLVPILITEVPVVTPLPRDRRVVKLNEALKAAVEGSPYIVVPIRKLGEVPLWRILSTRAEDGFHPNAGGYRGAALESVCASEALLKERDLWQDTADDLYS